MYIITPAKSKRIYIAADARKSSFVAFTSRHGSANKMDFELPNICSTFEINFEIPTERYIEKFMMKHLSPMEFNRWFGKRNITEERKKQCSICRNHCEVCIARYVGIPWS